MKRRTLIVVFQVLAMGIAFLFILARPGFGERPTQTQVADVEVMIVIDRTRSMSATDWNGKKPRIDGAESDLTELVDALPGTRFSLITWGTGAQVQLPFTNDTVSVLDAVRNIGLEDPYQSDGTDESEPLKVMTRELKRAEDNYPDRERMLIFISDGENTATAGSPANGGKGDYGSLRRYLDGGLVLGYGTTKGAPMPAAADLSADDGNLQIDGKDAISKANPDTLKNIAKATGAEYVGRSKPGGLAAQAKQFKGGMTTQEDDRGQAKYDLTWIPGLALFALALWVLHDAWRNIWTSPKLLGKAVAHQASRQV